jgi:predicted glutamine amidotransferase
MCGIAGYIGVSKKPKLSFELITGLFDYLETRGFDASGVWGTEHGGQGRIIYHKEPIRSSEFIRKDFWQRLKKIRTDMVLVHARATSSKGGNANRNINNHPFVSVDKRIGMVHNGNIDEADYLKNKYQTISQTDSECLLRIFEHGMDNKNHQMKDVPPLVSSRLSGIKDIWSYISSGAMAVALGERVDDHQRSLFLFRNEKRPLWLVDLRNLLGQIFFFSTPDIWHKAVSDTPRLQKNCWKSAKLIELPHNQAWYLGLDKDHNCVIHENVFRFKLDTKNTGVEFEQGAYKPIKPAQADLKIITVLNDDDEINLPKKHKNTSLDMHRSDEELWTEPAEDIDVPDWNNNFAGNLEHEQICKDILRIVQDVNVTAENLCAEGSLNANDYSMLLESLNQAKTDLEGTLRILRN